MKFISPLKVMVSKARHFLLNLNQYRNTHYRVLNQCKINYKEVMRGQIATAPTFQKVLCVYKVYGGSKRMFDIGNICSVHEKFFEDAFVELGKLPDDNYEYIPLVIYVGCGIDKSNPRVEVDVLPLTKLNIDLTIKEIYSILGLEGEEDNGI